MGAWRTPRKIWCKRADQPEPFYTNTRNVGSERFFYEFKELSLEDLAYIEHVISASQDQELQDVNRKWVEFFQRTFVLRRELETKEINANSRIELEVQLRGAEKMLGEKFHGGVESSAIPILDELRRGSSQFHTDPDKCSAFIIFLCFQYFRTAKLRNAMAVIDHNLPHDMRRTWPIEAFIYATNVGASLYRQRLGYRVIFLRNTSNTPFITADQPIINLRGVAEDALDFYYPLSPYLAIIYTGDSERYPHDTLQASAITVETYNHRVYSNSEIQIFGNDPEYLKEISNLPKII